MKRFDLTFLGTGTSTGTPIIGCKCDTCLSNDPRDNRLRTSVHIQYDGIDFIIDMAGLKNSVIKREY